MNEPQPITVFRDFTQRFPDEEGSVLRRAVCDYIDHLTTRIAEFVDNLGWANKRIAELLDENAALSADEAVVQTLYGEAATRCDALVRAIDEAMVNAHIGVFNYGDDPNAAINRLMVWAQGVGAHFAEQENATLRDRLAALASEHAALLVAFAEVRDGQ